MPTRSRLQRFCSELIEMHLGALSRTRNTTCVILGSLGESHIAHSSVNSLCKDESTKGCHANVGLQCHLKMVKRSTAYQYDPRGGLLCAQRRYFNQCLTRAHSFPRWQQLLLKNVCQIDVPTNNRRFSSTAKKNNTDDVQQGQTELSLKQLVRPFLMKFHPDRQGISSDTNNNTTIARQVNLEALQTLNGMIDTIDLIHSRALDPSKTNSRGRIDLKTKYTIEFLVSSQSSTFTNAIKKRKDVPSSSRRSVDLVYTNRDIEAVQLVNQNGRYSINAAEALKWKAMGQVGKLLRIAGLAVPNNLYAQIDEATSRSQSSLLEDELALGLEKDHDTTIFGRNVRHPQNRKNGHVRRKTPYEESRDRYMNSVDWKKYNKMYEEALEDAERDLATEGLISMSEERKQRLVAEVISKVRVFDEESDVKDNTENTGARDAAFVDRKLDALNQLIAIRRLSLLLNDNFDKLEMEEMGRLWETMVIVLTPERNSVQYNQEKSGLSYSRVKRLKRGRESGFKFAIDSDDRVTVYIPIDFLDDELLGEMKVHLTDFYSFCLSKGDLEDYFPSYYNEFKGQSNFDD